MKVLKIVQSFSGNTMELSELIEKNLFELDSSIQITTVKLKRKEKIDLTNYQNYDMIMLGTFTWGKGAVHRDMQQLFVDNIAYLRTLPIVYFGTGDTQFGGDELFCNAIEILNSKVPSSYPLLKIEQSPRGSQEVKVKQWCKQILKREL